MAHSPSSDPSGRRKMTNGEGLPRGGGLAGGAHASATRHTQRTQRGGGAGSSSPAGRVILINAPDDGGDESKDLHTITVDKRVDGRLGFSVRGGAEHGLSIFVSKVDDNSSAEQAGLCVGDKLVQVNGVGLESVTMASAVKVLTGSERLRMLVRRVGKVPGVRYSNEKTAWVDLIHRRMVVEESGGSPWDASSAGALRRTLHLYATSEHCCLGFNIRGGTEFGLGIYVSSLDPGGLAEQHGIKMGDQILSANGVSFEDITHGNAVEVLKSHAHIMLTIREAGRYPAYKEMVAEYSWLNKLSNGVAPSSGQGSGRSSASSLSSGTPVSSLSGLSQVLCTPVSSLSGLSQVLCTPVSSLSGLSQVLCTPVSSLSGLSQVLCTPVSSLSGLSQVRDMVDACVSTEDRLRRPGGSERPAPRAGPPPPRPDPASSPPSPQASQGASRAVAAETGRSLGATVLLKDTAVRGKGEGPVDTGGGARGGARDSPKTQVLMALSGARKPIRRSQSHITVTEDKLKKRGRQRGEEESAAEGGKAVRRSKTFADLLFGRRERGRHAGRDAGSGEAGRGRSKSTSRPADTDKESGRRRFKVRSLPRETRAGVRDSGPRPGPRTLTRTLAQVEEMAGRLLSPDEVAAVMRHCRRFLTERVVEDLVRLLLAILDRPEKLLLLREIRMLIPDTELERFNHLVTPFELDAYDFLKSRSDYRGGFLLRPVQGAERDRRLTGDLERLRLSGLQGRRPASASPSPSPSPFPGTFAPLLDVPVDGHAPAGPRSASRSPSPSPSPSSHNWLLAESAAEEEEEEEEEEGFAEVSVRVPAPDRGRPPVREAGGGGGGRGGRRANGHRRRPAPGAQDCDITAVCVSKARRSLGISISGGAESRVQPMIKIERIFPGGAASTSEVLKAGFELVSVDGECLQGVTHQHAVDVIRRAFANKAKDPMVLGVKVPRSQNGRQDAC